MSARDDILASVRRGLKHEMPGEAERTAVTQRLSQHRRNLIPARAASLTPIAQRDLFVRLAEGVQATVARVGADDVPAAVAQYLAAQNLPAEIVMAPDPALDAYPWASAPLLSIRRGRASETDAVGLTGAFAGIAETGTLMMLSGAGHPPSLHLLPDTHIAVLRADQVVGIYEEGWDRLRAAFAGTVAMPLGRDWMPPRTVSFVTGPSRTGDIEQRIQLGAHGPRRLHIVLVEP